MKTMSALVLTLLLSACSYNYPYSHPPATTVVATFPTSQYTIVNNSGYRLKVYQDGQFLNDLDVGEVQGIKGTLLWRRTVVTVTGTDLKGSYVGSDSWTYEFGTPEAWTVTRLNKPHEPR